MLLPALGSLAEEAVYPPLVAARGRTPASLNTTGSEPSLGQRDSTKPGRGEAGAAVLLFRRQVHPPRKEATVVLSGGVSGTPLVDGLISQVSYEIVNLGKSTAMDIRIYEDALNFPKVAFQRVDWPTQETKATFDADWDGYLLFSGLSLAPGASSTRNLSLLPHTHEPEGAKAATFTVPSYLDPVHVYELRPAKLTYRIEAQGLQRIGLSSTESLLVVESARGFDRRSQWHPQAWFVYFGSVGLLGLFPWVYARRLSAHVRARSPRTH